MIRVKNRRINPEQSNKMILAVGIGLLLLFTAYILFISLEKKPKTETEAVDQSVGYLRKVQSIVKMEWLEGERKLRIIYDPNIPSEIERIAHSAALRLSNKIKNFDLVLEKIFPTGPVYRIEVRNGEILKEEKKIE